MKANTSSVAPDHFTFCSLIATCTRAGEVSDHTMATVYCFKIEVIRCKFCAPCFSVPIFLFQTSPIYTCPWSAARTQVERALEVYNRMRSSRIKANIECYTAAVHACSQKGYLKSALSIFIDLKEDDIRPDEVRGHMVKIGEVYSVQIWVWLIVLDKFLVKRKHWTKFLYSFSNSKCVIGRGKIKATCYFIQLWSTEKSVVKGN